MSDVFISYSRKDIAFAKLIRQALQSSDLDTWIDWERIPVGENWWREICQAIAESNVFMFIISRNSIGSPVCKDEINEALNNRKRIIPIIVDDLSPDAVRAFAPDLPQINWIAFEQDHIFQLTENPEVVSDRPEDRLQAFPRLPQFEQALAKLSTAIHTDWEWVKFHTTLQVDALRWQSLEQNPDYLLRGDALQSAEQRVLAATGKDPAPSPLQAEYITASRQMETQRQQEEVRSQQEKLRLEQKARARQRLASWAIGIGLVIAIILGIFGWTQRNQYLSESIVRATAQAVAEEQRNTSYARMLAAQSDMRLTDHLDISLLLAAQSSKIKDTSEGRAILADTLVAHPALRNMLHSVTNQYLLHVGISLDNRWIAAGGTSGLITVWDAKTRQPVKDSLDGFKEIRPGFKGQILRIAFSNDSKFLIVQNSEGEINFWDTTTWQIARRIEDKSILLFLPFPGRDQLYLTAEAGGVVKVKDISTNSTVRSMAVCKSDPGDRVWNLAVSPDGAIIAVTCGQTSIQLWDLNTGQSISNRIALPLWIMDDLSFNPAGKSLAFGGRDGTMNASTSKMWIWDYERSPSTPDNLQSPQKLGDNCGGVYLAFSPDGKEMAMACGKKITVKSIVSKIANERTLSGVERNVSRLVYAPNGEDLIAGGSLQLYLWKPGEFHSIIKSGIKVDEPNFKSNAEIDVSIANQVAFTTSGQEKILVDAGCKKLTNDAKCIEGQISLTKITVGSAVRETLAGKFQEVTFLSAQPGSQWLASGHKDGSVNLWDIGTGKLSSQIEAPEFGVSGLDLSADGRWLVTSGKDLQLNLWNLNQSPPVKIELRTAQKFGNLMTNIYGVKITRDGKSLVEIGSYIVDQGLKTKIQVWDLPGRNVRFEIPYTSTFFLANRAPMAVSRDSKRAYLGISGYIKVLDLEKGEMLPSTILPTSTTIESLALSPEGRWIATGNNKAVTLWDATSLQIVTQIGAVDYGVNSLAFSDDSQILAATGNLEEIPLWDVSLSGWQLAACQIANRNLTPAEWQNYLPDLPYVKTCPDLP